MGYPAMLGLLLTAACFCGIGWVVWGTWLREMEDWVFSETFLATQKLARRSTDVEHLWKSAAEIHRGDQRSRSPLAPGHRRAAATLETAKVVALLSRIEELNPGLTLLPRFEFAEWRKLLTLDYERTIQSRGRVALG